MWFCTINHKLGNAPQLLLKYTCVHFYLILLKVLSPRRYAVNQIKAYANIIVNILVYDERCKNFIQYNIITFTKENLF